MKKWEKILYIIIGSMFVFLCIGIVWFNTIKESISSTSYELIGIAMQFFLLMIILSAMLPLFVRIFLLIKNGLHNVKICDDELFEIIDMYKKSWKESNASYKKQIQIINLYYAPAGKVDELVDKNQIERLYKRMDFLIKNRNLFDDYAVCFSSLLISIIASFINQIVSYNNLFEIIVGVIIIMVSFFAAILFKYAERGNAGSYKHLIDEYERKCLQNKIDEVEKKLIINNEDEKMLTTKQYIINELIKRRKKAKRKNKEEIENDIMCVEKLNLCLYDYSDTYINKFKLGDNEIFLAYDLEKGKENNYVGKLNLKTQDFLNLYAMIEKYNLVNFSVNLIKNDETEEEKY